MRRSKVLEKLRAGQVARLCSFANFLPFVPKMAAHMFNFYMGVDNLSNAKPPYATTGIGGGSSIYDAIGRFFYAGVKANF